MSDLGGGKEVDSVHTMAAWEEGGTKVLAVGVGQGAQSCSHVWSWGPRIDLGMYEDSDVFVSEHHLRCVWNMSRAGDVGMSLGCYRHHDSG